MNKIKKVKSYIDKFLGLLCGTLLFLSAGVIILGVLFRTFGTGIAWVEELVRFAVVWSAFLGAYVAMAHGEDIKVGMFDNHMSPKTKLGLGVFIEILVLIFLTTFFPLSIKYLIDVSKYKLAMTGMPFWFFYLAFPIGSFMMIVNSVLALIENINGLVSLHKNETKELNL